MHQVATPEESYAAEFGACRLAGMSDDSAHAHAQHAQRLQRDLVSGEMRLQARKAGSTEGHRGGVPFTALPANLSELRGVAAKAAKGTRHPRWFAIVALSYASAGGMRGLYRGRLGPKLAGRILGYDGKTDWMGATLRRDCPEDFAAAVAVGQKLVATWGDP